MFLIGDFARFGLVSVRSLRHYDALGLLAPARVDPVTSYRQVSAVIDGKLGLGELAGMLRLRRAELEASSSPIWTGWPGWRRDCP